LLHVRRLEFVAVDEFRVRQHTLERRLNPRLEVAVLPAPLVEAHQRADVFLGVEAAVRPARERRDDAFGARRLVRLARRLADEDAVTRRRALGLTRVERALDADAADVRVEREAGQASGLD